MFIELLIALSVSIFIWLNNFYYLQKYSSIYKIRKVNKDEDLIDSSKNYIFERFFNFLSVNYIFAIIKYNQNQIISKTLYTLFGSSIRITFNEKGKAIPYKSMFSSPIYSLLGIIPLLLGGLVHLSNISKQIQISGIIWIIIGFAIPSFIRDLISEFKEALQKIEEKNNVNK